MMFLYYILAQIVKDLWRQFVAAVSILALFIGLHDDLSKFLPEGVQGFYWFISALVGGLVITLVYYFLYMRRKENLQVKKQIQHVRKHMNELQGRCIEVEKTKSYYRLMFFHWRLEVELRKTSHLQGGVLDLPAIAPFHYMVYVFSNLVMRLQQGDEYVTVSNVDFWHSVLRSDGAFMDQNMKAANRGVVVNRVVMVDERILDDDELGTELNKLKQVVRYFNKKQKSNPREFRLMKHYFVLVKDYSNMIYNRVPYAIVTNSSLDKYMAILPSLYSESYKSMLKIEFGKYRDVHTEASYRVFEELFRQKQDKYTIEEMFDRFITDTTPAYNPN